MGINIYTNSKKVTQSFDMGYGGFKIFRDKIALLLDKEFGEHYATLSSCNTQSDYDKFNEKANNIVADWSDEKGLILDFLFGPDTDYELSPKHCKALYDLLKNISNDDDKWQLSYGAHYKKADFGEFKQTLLDCWKYKIKLYWS